MSYGKCPECGERGFLNERFMPHRCKPVFEWRCDERHDADDWSEVRARDAEEAAEKAGGRYDEEDYLLMRGREVLIFIRDEAGIVTKWHVTGEAVPQYSAIQAKDPS